MTVKNNILKLWHEKRPDIKTIAELERKIGLSNGQIRYWDQKVPTIKSAKKVAVFFNVPLGKVLNNANDSQVNLTAQDQEILTMFRKHTENMTESEKQDFQDSLDILMQTAKELIDRKEENSHA